VRLKSWPIPEPRLAPFDLAHSFLALRLSTNKWGLIGMTASRPQVNVETGKHSLRLMWSYIISAFSAVPPPAWTGHSLALHQ